MLAIVTYLTLEGWMANFALAKVFFFSLFFFLSFFFFFQIVPGFMDFSI